MIVRSHKKIIEDAGGSTTLSRMIGQDPNNVSAWKRLSSIPGRHWLIVSQAGVATLEELAAAAARDTSDDQNTLPFGKSHGFPEELSTPEQTKAEERIDWPNGAKMALSVVVNVEEGSEQSISRGDRGMEPVDELGIFIKAPIRNYSNESNYLYGIKAGAPRIVKLLKQYDIMASWTVAALSLENHPEIAQAIVELGHEPVSHGWRWVHQFKMDEAAERDFIRKSVTSIEKSTGIRPYGWLSRYMLTDNTRRLLIEEGFTYHMDDYSGDVPFWDRETVPEKPMVIVPYQLDSNDMKMWTDPAMTPEQWLNYAIRNFDQIYREGAEGNPKMMSLGLHLRIIGRAGRIWALKEFFRHVRKHEQVWVATRHQIAQHLAKVQPA